MTGRILVGALAALAIFLAQASPAAAHAKLVRTIPQDRAAVAFAPREVIVVFDEGIHVAEGNEVVRNDGDSVLGGRPSAVGKQLVLPLKVGLAEGAYSVLWSVVSDDGHLEQGVLAFSIGSKSPPQSILSSSDRVRTLDVVARWLFLLAILAAGGLVLFESLVLRPVAGRRLAFRAISISLGLVAIFSLGLAVQANAGTETRFGLVLYVCAALAALGSVVGFLGDRLRGVGPGLARAIAVGVLLAPTFSGHAVDSSSSLLDTAVDLAHVGATAFWVGSLAGLLIISRSRRFDRGVVAAAAKRFSRFAVLTVALIAATGVGRALSELSSISQIWSTGYGRTLVVKTFLFIVALALAMVSRIGLQRMRRTVGASVGAEVAVLAGLLVAVGLLTALPPGRAITGAFAAPTPAPQGVSQLPAANATAVAFRDRGYVAAIAVRPSGRAVVTFIGADSRAADVGVVTIDGREAASCGVGCYIGQTNGERVVTVTREGARLRFDLGLRIPARDLLARAARTFHGLKSIAYSQKIITGLGPDINVRWQEVAPDSFSYNVKGASRAVVLGTRRWDRDPGKRWEFSRVDRSATLTPPWGGAGPFANVELTARDTKTMTISFLGVSRTYPAWFQIVVARGSLNILHVRMTAAAHFMEATYEKWNAPIRLRPPVPAPRTHRE